MDKPCLIFDDPRPIEAVWFDGENTGGYNTKSVIYGCSKIVAYRENGQMDHVPFFAVYDSKGNIIARIPAHMVTVIYAED